MANVPLSFRATEYDLQTKSSREVFLEGEAYITGLGIGGGPIIPDKPPISPGVPTHPIVLPGDPSWGPPVYPAHPIVIPPNVPPILQPPTPPSPGDPTTPVPPPAGQAGWPVQPIVPPPYVVIQYPGIGPVIVAPPAPPAK